MTAQARTQSDLDRFTEVMRRRGRHVHCIGGGPPPEVPVSNDKFRYERCDPRTVPDIPALVLEDALAAEEALPTVQWVIGHEIVPEREKPRRRLFRRGLVIASVVTGFLIIGGAVAALVVVALLVAGVIAFVNAVVNAVLTAATVGVSALAVAGLVALVMLDPVLIAVVPTTGPSGQTIYFWVTAEGWTWVD